MPNQESSRCRVLWLGPITKTSQIWFFSLPTKTLLGHPPKIFCADRHVCLKSVYCSRRQVHSRHLCTYIHIIHLVVNLQLSRIIIFFANNNSSKNSIQQMSRNKYNWLLNVIMIVTLLMQVNGILVFGSFKLRSRKMNHTTTTPKI